MGNTSPLSQVASELKSLLRQESDAFLKGRQEDVIALGENTIRDILKAELYPYIVIPSLSSNPDPMEIAAREEILAERDRVFQVMASAEKQDAARVKRIRADAVGVVAKVAGGLGGVVFTVVRGLVGI